MIQSEIILTFLAKFAKTMKKTSAEASAWQRRVKKKSRVRFSFVSGVIKRTKSESVVKIGKTMTKVPSQMHQKAFKLLRLVEPLMARRTL